MLRDRRPIEEILIVCADVGSVPACNFGFYASNECSGRKPSELAELIAGELSKDRRVALGFECPLFAPIPDNEQHLGKARVGEGNRPWSAGAGSGSMATGLVQTAWILDQIRVRLGKKRCSAYLEWNDFEKADRGLLLWEAFVTGQAKGSDHIDDAKRGVEAFKSKLPRPSSDVYVDGGAISIAGTALIWAGWLLGKEALRQQCIAIKA